MAIICSLCIAFIRSYRVSLSTYKGRIVKNIRQFINVLSGSICVFVGWNFCDRLGSTSIVQCFTISFEMGGLMDFDRIIKTLKKVAGIGVGVVMIGATIIGALA